MLTCDDIIERAAQRESWAALLWTIVVGEVKWQWRNLRRGK